MKDVIREYLEMAKVGRKQVYKNLAFYPLLSDSEYIPLMMTNSWLFSRPSDS